MELISIEDVQHVIVDLKKFVRISDPGEHKTLYKGGVRDVDFLFSPDRSRVLASEGHGLSFVTNMRQLKSLAKLKAKRSSAGSLEIYSIEESCNLPKGLKFFRDKPGHAFLAVEEEMEIGELIKKLEQVALIMKDVGVMKL